MKLIKRILPSLGDIARATAFPTFESNSKKQFILVYFIRLVFLVSQRLWRDKCPRQAAALSFQTMLSVVPLFAVVAAITSAFKLDAYRERLTDFLESNLLPEAAGRAGTYIVALASSVNLKTLGLAGGFALLILAMTLLFNVEQAVNEVFRCAKQRGLFRRIVSTFLLLVGVPLGFGLSLYFTRDLFTLSGFVHTLLPLVFTVFALFLCYWLLPRPTIRVGYAAISAIVSGVAFEALKIGFALYAKHLGTTLSYVYGTVAILPLFMVWNYMAWLIFLFGAELNASLHEVKRHDRFAPVREERFFFSSNRSKPSTKSGG